MILGANGAGELIDLIPRVIKPGLVIIPVPSYGEYERSCRTFKTEQLVLKEENNFLLDPDLLSLKLYNSPGNKLVFIGQPNNPTGTLVNPDIIVSLAEKHRDTFFCIDESFAGFIPGYTSLAGCIVYLFGRVYRKKYAGEYHNNPLHDKVLRDTGAAPGILYCLSGVYC